jgi:rsbT co-antagonist protein RsbR
MADLTIEASDAPVGGLDSELQGSITEVLELLRRVGNGDLENRLELRYPETHPLGALALSVNVMLESLADLRQQSEAYSRELQDKLIAIEQQQTAIAELSTPIMEVWKGALCLPIVGMVDSARTYEMAHALLSAIVRTKASYALIDITGIQVMDTRVVDHFIHMARAVRLLGARCVLTGVHPNVSRTIVQMGIDLQGVETHRSMRDALRQFVASSMAGSSRSAMKTAPGVRGGPEAGTPDEGATSGAVRGAAAQGTDEGAA